MTKQHQTFELKLSEVREEGSFTGRASVYGVRDSQGDVVMPGAFSKTIRDNGGVIKILAQHDPTDVIGKARLVDKSDALWVEGQLVLDLPSAREMYARLKNGLIDGLSIGYETVESRPNRGVRELHEVNLWEVSLVTYPANFAARVQAVKGDDPILRAILANAHELRDQALSNLIHLKILNLGARLERMQREYGHE